MMLLKSKVQNVIYAELFWNWLPIPAPAVVVTFKDIE